MMLTAPRRRLFAVATVALTTVALAACGTTEEPPGASGASAAPAAGPVDVTDERGPVHLDAPAANVVSLEWGLTENLVSLGVKPIGQADVKGYNAWVTVAPIDAGTSDVGTRGEPSLDAIVALKPDLVVTTTDVPETAIAQLAKQVPVLTLKGSDGKDPIAYMRRTVTTLAQVTGTQARGEKLLADFDAKVTTGRAALDAAGRTAAPFVMADGWLESGNVSVRMYTPTSYFGGVAGLLGLKNQWPNGGDAVYGLAQTDVEGLTRITDAKTAFLYAANDSDGGDVFTTGLKDNAVWKQRPFVASQNVHRIPDGIWMFGGPVSGGAYIDALVAAISKA